MLLVYRILRLDLRNVGVLFYPMACDLLPSRKPDIIKRCEIFNHALESDKSTWASYPSGMESDGDICALTLVSFLANNTDGLASRKRRHTHSKALIQC